MSANNTLEIEDEDEREKRIRKHPPAHPPDLRALYMNPRVISRTAQHLIRDTTASTIRVQASFYPAFRSPTHRTSALPYSPCRTLHPSADARFFPIPCTVLSRVQAFLPALEAANNDLAHKAKADPSSVDIEHISNNAERYIEMVCLSHLSRSACTHPTPAEPRPWPLRTTFLSNLFNFSFSLPGRH